MTLAFLLATVLIGADEPKKPLFATVDLDRCEAVQVEFPALTPFGVRWANRALQPSMLAIYNLSCEWHAEHADEHPYPGRTGGERVSGRDR